jgi:hypothetical protein
VRGLLSTAVGLLRSSSALSLLARSSVALPALLRLPLLLLLLPLLLLLSLLHQRLTSLVHDGRRGDVKSGVDDRGHGLDLGAELLLDSVEVESVLVGEEVDGESEVTESTGSSDSMQVGLGGLGEVLRGESKEDRSVRGPKRRAQEAATHEVDDNVDGLDIDTSSEEVRADEVSADSLSEVVEDSVSVSLEHLCVRVEARVAELGDLLGEKLDSICRVAEDDGLVDLKLKEGRRERWSVERAKGCKAREMYLGEKGVETVNLLSLLDEGVVLGDSSKRELLHEVDLVGLNHVLLLEVLDDDGEGGREEGDLSLGGAEAEELLHYGLELGREELVGLVHDEGRALAQVGDTFAGEVENSSRRTDEDMDGLGESHDVILESGSSGGDHDVDAEVLTQGLGDL